MRHVAATSAYLLMHTINDDALTVDRAGHSEGDRR